MKNLTSQVDWLPTFLAAPSGGKDYQVMPVMKIFSFKPEKSNSYE